VDDLLKMAGGPQGLFAIMVALGALFWRIKIPQIGVDYLQRELEFKRNELEEGDKDRAALRDEVKRIKVQAVDFERDYMGCLSDREKCRRHIRALEHQLRDLGQEPIAGDEDR
jgi:septal ring factor EnvC (AmiA/AmiB activator)